MWDKKGENIGFKWFYSLKEQKEEEVAADAKAALQKMPKEKAAAVKKKLDKIEAEGGEDALFNALSQLASLMQTSGLGAELGVGGVNDPALNALYSSEKVSPVAKEAIETFFKDPQAGWLSTASTKRYNRGLNWTLGPIPYKGSTSGRGNAKLNQDWIRHNIKRVNSPAGSFRINKHVANSLLAAIEESRNTYGVPMANVGGFVVKGNDRGFSSHTWGAGIDFDHWVNPFTPGGAIPPSLVNLARSGGKGTSKYWNLTNPQGQTWKQYLDSIPSGQAAVPLYVFLAGPFGNNGIGKIFNKHGWRWGGDYKGKKDTMHFEKFNLDDFGGF